MPYDFGDIILVKFPFTNQTAFKQRPAVIVSNRSYNDTKLDIVIMAITSQLRASASLGEVWIDGWEAANLLKPSAIKPVFATIEQTLVIKSIGSLPPSDFTGLRTAIHTILA